ncbi:MAG TPA: DinB family protein [Thermoanaerobaculia bacterium]|jgi:uncharacterized damage-inducible protein DinB
MIAQSLLPELDLEIANTRKLLERIPFEHADWRPHPRSYTLGDLATHVGNLFNWVVMTIEQEEFDTAAPFQRPTFTSTEELLARFDTTAAKARAALAGASDETLMAKWTLRHGEHVVFTLPRVAVLRTACMNHLIHHRGQLTVYLRLKDVPLPSIYGPTADEH